MASDDDGLALLTALTGAALAAHTERTLVDSVAAALGTGARVELAIGPRRWAAGSASAASTWTVDAGEAGTLRIAAGAGAELTDGARGLAGAVLRGALGQLRTLGRVAALSRRAHSERESFRLALSTRDGDLVARSEVMRRLVDETLPLVAFEDVTVLLRGETGVGKELVARRIHARSRRAHRPLVTVNCGALPETLAESTLFGHERGAFTGASARHLGVFERAHGGTLFLDEVGELSPAMQARLLRVLDTGELVRLGGTAAIRIDARVVAASHRDLAGRVREGAFREDLFYRLNVVPLDVPPLRARPEDLEPLVDALLAAAAAKMGRGVPALVPADRERLRRWPWPGNVRELRNLLERALVLSPGDTLELPPGWDASPPALPSSGTERFDDAQRRILRDALAAAGGRIYGADGAAARLGLRPTTLQSKLERLGLRART